MQNILFIDNAENSRFIRAARYENGRPAEFYTEDIQNASIIGNIYLARVMRILPSRFIFLDIGAGRNAFLHLGDYKERYLSQKTPPKQGDACLVQTVKDETPKKGAYVTTQVSFTNKHFAVFLNGCGEAGISQKITDAAERKRLKAFARARLPDDLGVIIRTEAAGLPEDKLSAALSPLIAEARVIQEKSLYAMPPVLLKKQDSLTVKTADKLLTRDIQKIIINRADDALAEYIKNTYDNPPEIELYDGEVPLFAEYGIEAELKKALDKNVWLKSGGFLIIEETEACACIDVNSGKNIKGGYEDTVRVTNAEAAYEAARQIRLRNLSGLILIDFINPKTAENLHMLRTALIDALKSDRLPVKIEYATEIGVFLLIRKKAYGSLSKTYKEETL